MTTFAVSIRDEYGFLVAYHIVEATSWFEACDKGFDLAGVDPDGGKWLASAVPLPTVLEVAA